MAKINLSKAITLTRDDGTALELPAGVQAVDKDVAGHWYVKAHLVSETDANDDEAENEAKAKEAAKGKTTTGKSTG